MTAVLADAFERLSPHLADRYHALLSRELAESPELAALHQRYTAYATRDTSLPRPVLAYFGYHAHSDAVDFGDVDSIGDGLLISQLLRDVLAIHDDVVDEDLEKFGAPPLPAALSSLDGTGTGLTKRGKDLALYYGDLLVGLMLRLAAELCPPDTAAAATRLIADTLYVNQRGQLAELLTETRPLAETSLDELLLIGERKAAHYCYVFPFALGAALAGHRQDLGATYRLLARIGTASQVIDDITGTFPGIVDDDKDTLAEIAHLRRTVPLALLAHQADTPSTRAVLAADPPLTGTQARELRDALWNSAVLGRALQLSEQLLNDITPQLTKLPLGRAAREYLSDLVHHRLDSRVQRLRQAL